MPSLVQRMTSAPCAFSQAERRSQCAIGVSSRWFRDQFDDEVPNRLEVTKHVFRYRLADFSGYIVLDPEGEGIFRPDQPVQSVAQKQPIELRIVAGQGGCIGDGCLFDADHAIE